MKSRQELIDLGYRVISRKFGRITRIDRKDWVNKCYRMLGHQDPAIMKSVEDFYLGKDFTGSFQEETVKREAAMAADYYRRCISKDVLEITQEMMRGFPNSNHDITGYIDGPDQKNRNLKYLTKEGENYDNKNCK